MVFWAVVANYFLEVVIALRSPANRLLCQVSRMALNEDVLVQLINTPSFIVITWDNGLLFHSHDTRWLRLQYTTLQEPKILDTLNRRFDQAVVVGIFALVTVLPDRLRGANR